MPARIDSGTAADRASAPAATAHANAWRSPAQIMGHWLEAAAVDPPLLEMRASRQWWNVLADLGITLFVTREYEHLIVALSARDGRPRTSCFSLPHPSGIAANRRRTRLWVAATRNPNQVLSFQPAAAVPRPEDRGRPRAVVADSYLMPTGSTFYPGSLYLHDLAIVGGTLHGNAVGWNVVVRLDRDGAFAPAWWPRCVERRGQPVMSANYIQLNSIAAGPTLRTSYFSASSTSIGRRRPGDLDYRVDRRGVLFGGATREPICTGLTRPHSARLARNTIWLANSGYGQVGRVERGAFEPVRTLAGWTRGLAIVGRVVFVGTSRVIPRYARYAPGVDIRGSVCGVHAVDMRSGALLGSIEWPAGAQIFGVEWMPDRVTSGFVFDGTRGGEQRARALAYAYTIGGGKRGRLT
jgi:uncharacterized protein (TIGR03032 family)